LERTSGPSPETAIVDLVLTEICRYNRSVDELDPPHGARFTLTGADILRLSPGDMLQGSNSVS
jgi:hypothetical protein